MIRLATKTDIPGLVALETECFSCERLSRRNFQHLFNKGRTTIWVAEQNGILAGYCVVLFRSTSKKARLYSIAVKSAARGQGLAADLVQIAEQSARQHQCDTMLLEVRVDNPAAIALYRKLGYEQFGSYHNYYEDQMDAVRFRKFLPAERLR